MGYSIKTADDLRWFLTHAQGFSGGHVLEVHLSKRWVFDEESMRQVLAGSAVSVVVWYETHGVPRLATLTMQGVSDLSLLEQDGADWSALSTVQVELCDGRFRFWFDPQGVFYVVCEDVWIEEHACAPGEQRGTLPRGMGRKR